MKFILVASHEFFGEYSHQFQSNMDYDELTKPIPDDLDEEVAVLNARTARVEAFIRKVAMHFGIDMRDDAWSCEVFVLREDAGPIINE